MGMGFEIPHAEFSKAGHGRICRIVRCAAFALANPESRIPHHGCAGSRP
jgi:hypothetical protein